MEITAVLEDLTQFQTYVKQIDMTFNQYLLAGKESVLIHTGDRQLADSLVREVVSILQGRPLSYIFISHFESDECGSLRFWLDRFHDARPVCSEVTARQLAGFDIATNAIVKKPGETLETSEFALRFVGYPSEMHLWEGLLAFEKRRKVLFSSDLFGRRGSVAQSVLPMVWEQVAQNVTPMQIPSIEARSAIVESLRSLPVDFVAPGHGPVLKTASAG